MISFYNKYQNSGNYSQFGEAGLIDECVRRINPKELTAVEFGAPDWYYCSNTAHLHEYGWVVNMFDIHSHDYRVTNTEITVDNINDLVGNPTLLSIDCDGPDATLWEAYNGIPDIVLIEIDSSVLPPAEQQASKHNAASYWVMVQLGLSKGYFLVCHTGGNLVWVLNKHKGLFPEIDKDPLNDWELYFDKRHVK